MTRGDGGFWLPIHTGLLDDERWTEAGPAREAWIVLYLQIAREPDPGWFRDMARVVFLLRKHNVNDAELKAAALVDVEWLVQESDQSPRLTIRKWSVYAAPMARKAVYNADRPTTRTGRGARPSPVETGGALDKIRQEQKKGEPRGEGPSPPPTTEEANRIFGELAKKGVIGTPRILGQRDGSVE